MIYSAFVSVGFTHGYSYFSPSGNYDLLSQEWQLSMLPVSPIVTNSYMIELINFCEFEHGVNDCKTISSQLESFQLRDNIEYSKISSLYFSHVINTQ